jgi:hypothetical protein
MILNRHFREFFELLEKHRVEYLVVGGTDCKQGGDASRQGQD